MLGGCLGWLKPCVFHGMTIEIVDFTIENCDFPIKNGGSFQFAMLNYDCLPPKNAWDVETAPLSTFFFDFAAIHRFLGSTGDSLSLSEKTAYFRQY